MEAALLPPVPVGFGSGGSGDSRGNGGTGCAAFCVLEARGLAFSAAAFFLALAAICEGGAFGVLARTTCVASEESLKGLVLLPHLMAHLQAGSEGN
eukprot:191903-Pleurochrysis_carterae.AAC.1